MESLRSLTPAGQFSISVIAPDFINNPTFSPSPTGVRPRRALRRHTEGVGSITSAVSNLGELFSVLDEKFPNLKPHLRDDKGQIRRFLNI